MQNRKFCTSAEAKAALEINSGAPDRWVRKDGNYQRLVARFTDKCTNKGN